MAERDGGSIGNAGGLFKRILERVGATVDEKLTSADRSRLPSTAVGAMAAAVERSVEENVRDDARGVRRLAPDHFEVLLTYEQDASLTDPLRSALAGELAATAYEYIANHRYVTLAPVYLEVGCDLFAKATHIRATFSPAPGETSDGAVRLVRTTAGSDVKQVEGAGADFRFVGPRGMAPITLRLAPGGEPATIGRGAGNRFLIDHASLSKFHATVSMTKDGQLVVADLGSTNGTFVGGRRAPIDGLHAILPGDTVVFGEVPVRIERVE